MAKEKYKPRTGQNNATNDTRSIEKKRAELMKKTLPYLKKTKIEQQDVERELRRASKRKQLGMFAALAGTRTAKPQAESRSSDSNTNSNNNSNNSSNNKKPSLFREFSTGKPVDKGNFLKHNNNVQVRTGRSDQQHESKTKGKNKGGPLLPTSGATDKTPPRPSTPKDGSAISTESRPSHEGDGNSSLTSVQQTAAASTVQNQPVQNDTAQNDTVQDDRVQGDIVQSDTVPQDTNELFLGSLPTPDSQNDEPNEPAKDAAATDAASVSESDTGTLLGDNDDNLDEKEGEKDRDKDGERNGEEEREKACETDNDRASNRDDETDKQQQNIVSTTTNDCIQQDDSTTTSGGQQNVSTAANNARQDINITADSTRPEPTKDEILRKQTARLAKRLRRQQQRRRQTTMISPHDELMVQMNNQANREAALRRLAEAKQNDAQKCWMTKDNQPVRTSISQSVRESQNTEDASKTTPAGTPLAPTFTTVPPSTFTPLPQANKAVRTIEGSQVNHPGRLPTYGEAVIWREVLHIKKPKGVKLNRDEFKENKRRAAFRFNEKNKEKDCHMKGQPYLAKKYASRLFGYPSNSHQPDSEVSAAPAPQTVAPPTPENSNFSNGRNNNVSQAVQDPNEGRLKEIAEILQGHISHQDAQSNNDRNSMPPPNSSNSGMGLRNLIPRKRAETAPIDPRFNANSAFSGPSTLPQIHQTMSWNDTRTDEEQMRQREEEKRQRNRDNRQELAETVENARIESLRSKITRLDRGQSLTAVEMPEVTKILKRKRLLSEPPEVPSHSATIDYDNEDDEDDRESSVASEEGETEEEYAERCRVERERRRAEKIRLQSERQRKAKEAAEEERISGSHSQIETDSQERVSKRVRFEIPPAMTSTGISNYASALLSPQEEEEYDASKASDNQSNRPHQTSSSPTPSGRTVYPRLDDYYPSPPKQLEPTKLGLSSEDEVDEQDEAIESSETETLASGSHEAQSDEEEQLDDDNDDDSPTSTSAQITSSTRQRIRPNQQPLDYYIRYRVTRISHHSPIAATSELYGPYQSLKAVHLAARRMLELCKDMLRRPSTGTGHWDFQESMVHCKGLLTLLLMDDDTNVYIRVKKRPRPKVFEKELSELVFYEVRQRNELLLSASSSSSGGGSSVALLEKNEANDERLRVGMPRETGRGAFVDYGLAEAEASRVWQGLVDDAAGREDITFSIEPAVQVQVQFDATTTALVPVMSNGGGAAFDEVQDGPDGGGDGRSVDGAASERGGRGVDNDNNNNEKLFSCTGIYEQRFDDGNNRNNLEDSPVTAFNEDSNENEQEATQTGLVQRQPRRRERVQVWVEEKILRGL